MRSQHREIENIATGMVFVAKLIRDAQQNYFEFENDKPICKTSGLSLFFTEAGFVPKASRGASFKIDLWGLESMAFNGRNRARENRLARRQTRKVGTHDTVERSRHVFEAFLKGLVLGAGGDPNAATLLRDWKARRGKRSAD